MNTTALIWRKYWIENRRIFLAIIGILLGTSAIIGLWTGYFLRGGTPKSCGFYFILAGFVASVIASGMFPILKNKERRISFLMTPATMAQKFWPRFLVCFPGLVILMIAGFYTFDLFRVLGGGIFHKIWLPFTDPFNVFFTVQWNDRENVVAILFLIGICLNNLAYFFMGGILWPRYSFLISMGVMFVFQMLLSTILGIVLANATLRIDYEIANIIGYALTALSYLVTALFFWLGYRQLKRTTLTSDVFKK